MTYPGQGRRGSEVSHTYLKSIEVYTKGYIEAQMEQLRDGKEARHKSM